MSDFDKKEAMRDPGIVGIVSRTLARHTHVTGTPDPLSPEKVAEWDGMSKVRQGDIKLPKGVYYWVGDFDCPIAKVRTIE